MDSFERKSRAADSLADRKYTSTTDSLYIRFKMNVKASKID